MSWRDAFLELADDMDKEAADPTVDFRWVLGRFAKEVRRLVKSVAEPAQQLIPPTTFNPFFFDPTNAAVQNRNMIEQCKEAARQEKKLATAQEGYEGLTDGRLLYCRGGPADGAQYCTTQDVMDAYAKDARRPDPQGVFTPINGNVYRLVGEEWVWAEGYGKGEKKLIIFGE
jgi:hypothetical protein